MHSKKKPEPVYTIYSIKRKIGGRQLTNYQFLSPLEKDKVIDSIGELISENKRSSCDIRSLLKAIRTDYIYHADDFLGKPIRLKNYRGKTLELISETETLTLEPLNQDEIDEIKDTLNVWNYKASVEASGLET